MELSKIIKELDSKLRGVVVLNISTGFTPHVYKMSQKAKEYIFDLENSDDYDSANVNILKKSLGCGVEGCSKTAQEHTEKKVCYVKLTRDISRKEVKDNQIAIAEISAKYDLKLNGVGISNGTFKII